MSIGLLLWTLLLLHTLAFGPTVTTTKTTSSSRSHHTLSSSSLSSSSVSSSSSASSSSELSLVDPTDLALPLDPTRIRYRCRVAYDGTGFSGFQLQGEKRTIQKVLEDVLQQRFGRSIRVVGAGRTDAGVHARGQAIHFDLTLQEHSQLLSSSSSPSSSSLQLPQDESRLEKSMNRMLPTDIRVWNVGLAPAPALEVVNNQTSIYAWNVMRKCDSKLYSYRLCLGNAMDPMLRRNRWQLDNGWVSQIDPVVLAEIFQSYEGTHDFVCFAGALEANARKTGVMMSTIRTVYSCKLICEDNDDDGDHQLYRVDIYLDGALYKMVRNLVGTAIDACRGKLNKETFHQLLNEPSRHGLTRDDNPCKPAPPHGLTLERVFYPNDDF